MYYSNPFSEEEMNRYRKTLPKQAAPERKGKKKQMGETASMSLDALLAEAAASGTGTKKTQKKSHQKELIQEYLDNGGIPGRYGENLPDDPRALKEEDLGI